MDINVVMQIISNFGFPILCCLAMFWYVYKSQESFQNTIEKMQQMHKEEEQKMGEAINNNTLVMTKLLERLDR